MGALEILFSIIIIYKCQFMAPPSFSSGISQHVLWPCRWQWPPAWICGAFFEHPSKMTTWWPLTCLTSTFTASGVWQVCRQSCCRTLSSAMVGHMKRRCWNFCVRILSLLSLGTFRRNCLAFSDMVTVLSLDQIKKRGRRKMNLTWKDGLTERNIFVFKY